MPWIARNEDKKMNIKKMSIKITSFVEIESLKKKKRSEKKWISNSHPDNSIP